MTIYVAECNIACLRVMLGGKSFQWKSLEPLYGRETTFYQADNMLEEHKLVQRAYSY
jgi:hypothetical protein